jgi:hypothetical protein
LRYTADQLIEKRKQKWAETGSIDYDKRLRKAIARELVKDAQLLEEVRRYPEKLIELLFIVVDKNQKTMPFFLNEVQHDFIDTINRAKEDFEAGKITDISLLVLKGRQQGFTTLVTAYQLACCILNRNFQGFTLADKSDNSEAIFQNKAKFPYAQLPDCMKPTEKFNNRKQLLFSKINSSWAVDTATKDVGRSRTVNFFHGSECAFWKDGIARIQAALGEALTKNCIKIYESTANGYNDYQKMWDSGSHINCFYEWWRTKEYRIDFLSREAKDDFLEKVAKSGGWIWERLRWLRDEKNLEAEQLFWYFNKWDKYLDKDLIKQEYPCTPREAFLLSGKNVFDTAALLMQLEYAPKPLKTGYFTYDYDGLQITNIQWVNDRNGYIKLYVLPKQLEFTSFCIGGDTAGSDSGSDWFTGHVLDARTGIQVAHLRQQFDADQYVKQIFCLAKYYRDAMVGIEANFGSFENMELQRLGYENLYVRESFDTYTGKTEKRFGFKTTSLTRPTIIAKLVEIVREHCEIINDVDTLEELLTIIRNEKTGRIEAPAGGHDDEMMGLAIAHHIRDQVMFEHPVIEMNPQRHFGVTRYEREDYGEEIPII